MLSIGVLLVATLALVAQHPRSLVAAAFVGGPVRAQLIDAQPDGDRGAFNVQHQLLNSTAVDVEADWRELQLLDEETLDNGVDNTITYTLGGRISGDNLVAHTAKNQRWATPQNVRITLSYPAAGVGAQVTYVVVQVDQSSNSGRAYVVRGGLHQRFISLVVEANNTLYVNYSAQFYGV